MIQPNFKLFFLQYTLITITFASSPHDFYRIGSETSAIFKFQNDKEAELYTSTVVSNCNYDVILRPGVEPNEILFKIQNFEYQDNLEDQNSVEIEVMQLPFAVKVEKDFEWSNLQINSEETYQSLMEKQILIDLLISKQVVIDESLEPGHTEFETISSPLGSICRVNHSLANIEDAFVVEISENRNECNGGSKLHYLQNEISNGSYTLKINLNKQPMQLIKAEELKKTAFLKSKEIKRTKNFLSVVFIETRPITDEFDWSSLDQSYTKKEFAVKMHNMEKENKRNKNVLNLIF